MAIATGAIFTIAIIALGAEDKAAVNGLLLKVEPLKQHNILYEPVVIRVMLENTGTEAVSVSPFWEMRPSQEAWTAFALDIEFAAIPKKVSSEVQEPPPDTMFQALRRIQSGTYSPGGKAPLLLPQGRRLHFHALLWGREDKEPETQEELINRYMRGARRDRLYMMESPGTLWVRARYRHHNPPIVSKAVPIRFEAVPPREERAAANWKDPSLGSALQYYRDLAGKRLSQDEIKDKLRRFLQEFPRSVYAPYARAAWKGFETNTRWAQTYFEENYRGKDLPSPIQLTLHLPKRRYLNGEPFVVAAEVKNVSDEPVRIDPRLEHKYGWLKLLTVPDLELKRQRILEGLEPGSPLTRFDEPVHAEPKDWRPVTLEPGESRRKVFVFPDITDGPERSWILWGEYRGGPGGLVESESLEVEVVDTSRGQLDRWLDLAREKMFKVPKNELDPLTLWRSNANVGHFLVAGNNRYFPSLPPARPVLDKLLQKYPHSLYAFYARAVLAHPDDWAERLMNDPNTPWPQVPDPRNLARVGLVVAGGGALLLLLVTVVVLRRRRHPRDATAEPASTPSAV